MGRKLLLSLCRHISLLGRVARLWPFHGQFRKVWPFFECAGYEKTHLST